MKSDIKDVITKKASKEQTKRPMGFRKKIMIYTLLSVMATVIFEICLIADISAINNLMFENKNVQTEVSKELVNSNNDAISKATKPYYEDGKLVLDIDGALFKRVKGSKTLNYQFILVALFCLSSGIAVFIAVFFKLTEKFSDETRRIEMGIGAYAQGDFSESIEVDGNDELASIARNINLLANNFQKIREDEHNTEVAKNELITSIAHDLRTPITSIIGYLELINTRQLDEETKDRYTNIAYEKSQRLEHLIEDLFTYTKFSLGQFTTNFGTLDLVKLIEQLADEFYPRIMEEHLNYEFESKAPSIMIEADGELLARLFANLLSNSLKYGKDGKSLKVSVEQCDDTGVVKVTNFGKVIPKEDLDKIFERFYRLENSRSRATGGSGLGLSIVKQIVDIHNGTINVTSGALGTTFTVVLPLVRRTQ